MLLVTLFPVELQIQIFSELSFHDQVSIARVCRLWKFLLATSGRLRRARYNEIELAEARNDLNLVNCRSFQQYPQTDSSSFTTNPRIHRLLYNKYQCDSSCLRCNEIYALPYIIQNYLRGTYGFPELHAGHKHQLALPPKPFSHAYLNAILCQETLQITSYEICFETCPLEPMKSPTKIKLPVNHPFFDDPVFSTPIYNKKNSRSDITGVDSGKDEERMISVLHLLHLPRVVWQVCPDSSLTSIHVSPAISVRQLITRTWHGIREVYLSKPHPYAEIMEYVRISFKPSEDEIGVDGASLSLRLEVAVGEGYWEQVNRKLVWRGKMPEPGLREWRSPDPNLYRRLGNHVDRLFASHHGHGSCCKQEHVVLHRVQT
ncbi:hypothetical protein TWF506_004079 [Arthrobotrys conoides]|uniref:F-box domain-containing protein n=1 Tax=Arthrobotrys conoides TaxID=74498 RepID=A0AAN8RTS6_9PEZI